MALTQITLRRDTSANWALANPVLALGEPGYDITVDQIKYGDGRTVWLQLPFSVVAANDATSAAQILNPVTLTNAAVLSVGHAEVLRATAAENAIIQSVSAAIRFGNQQIEFPFPAPAGTWVVAIPDTLARLPAVTVYDSTGSVILADITVVGKTLSVKHASPVSGWVEIT